MRILYYVPIAHDPAEMPEYCKTFIDKDTQKKLTLMVENQWKQIKERIEKENLDYTKLFIYQDSIGIKEDRDGSKSEVKEELIRILKEKQTPNLLFLAELIEKGATLRGTESPELLQEEWQMHNDETRGIPVSFQKKTELLRKRDKFIAKRINETLPDGSCGILFVGKAHWVDQELQEFPNLKIIYISNFQEVKKVKTESQKVNDGKRTLYYVPIVGHTPEELGSLAKPVMKAEKRKGVSPEAYQERLRRFWEKIREAIKGEGLNTPEKCKKMHIYVDGLAVQPFYCKTCFDKTREKHYMDEITSNKVRCSICERVAERSVEEFLLGLTKALIEKRIPEYLIIEKLMERGARIHSTESWELVVEERTMWSNAVEGITPDQKRKTELLRERDKFIARRINETLPENEIGILFLGRVHKVVEELDKLEEAGELTSPLKVVFLIKLIYE